MISRLLGRSRKPPNASRVSKPRMARFIPNAEINEPPETIPRGGDMLQTPMVATNKLRAESSPRRLGSAGKRGICAGFEVEWRRRQLGLSQLQLAAMIGRSQGQLANALRGHDPISGVVVNRLRDILIRGERKSV